MLEPWPWILVPSSSAGHPGRGRDVLHVQSVPAAGETHLFLGFHELPTPLFHYFLNIHVSLILTEKNDLD